jgi:hypothetical protein
MLAQTVMTASRPSDDSTGHQNGGVEALKFSGHFISLSPLSFRTFGLSAIPPPPLMGGEIAVSKQEIQTHPEDYLYFSLQANRSE